MFEIGFAGQYGFVAKGSESAGGENGRAQEEKLYSDICGHGFFTFARSAYETCPSNSLRADCRLLHCSEQRRVQECLFLLFREKNSVPDFFEWQEVSAEHSDEKAGVAKDDTSKDCSKHDESSACLSRTRARECVHR